MTKEDLIHAITEMIRRFEDLPMHAKLMPITHSDYHSLLILLLAALKLDEPIIPGID